MNYIMRIFAAMQGVSGREKGGFEFRVSGFEINS